VKWSTARASSARCQPSLVVASDAGYEFDKAISGIMQSIGTSKSNQCCSPSMHSEYLYMLLYDAMYEAKYHLSKISVCCMTMMILLSSVSKWIDVTALNCYKRLRCQIRRVTNKTRMLVRRVPDKTQYE
jgi:hypothetical protein